MASLSYRKPFWAVYLSPSGPTCSTIGEHFENLAKICLKLNHTLTRLTICKKDDVPVLPEQLLLRKVHLLRHRLSLKTKLISNQAPFLPRTEPCLWNVMTNSRSNLRTTRVIHVKPLARNKIHTPPPEIWYDVSKFIKLQSFLGIKQASYYRPHREKLDQLSSLHVTNLLLTRSQ